MPNSILHVKMPQLSPLHDLTSFFVGVPIFIIAHLLRVLSLLEIEKKKSHLSHDVRSRSDITP